MSKNHASGRRRFLQILFGRTMVILLLLLIQFGFLFFLISYAEKYIPYLFGSVTVFGGILLIYILNTESNPSFKLSWAFFIGILPVFGALMYLFTKIDLGHRLEQKAVQSAIDETKTLLNGDKTVDIPDKQFVNLAAYLDKCGFFPCFKGNDVKFFPLGEDKARELLFRLEQAEKFIFLEYFIIKDGELWQAILDILKRKAASGVEVRILYDGTNAVFNLPYNYPKKLRAMGIRCKMFSPLRPFVSTYYNNRDHRKIVVIDGKIAFTGGINLADEYVNLSSPLGHWKDTAVMVEGSAVNAFTVMFLQMWNADEKNRIYDRYIVNHENHGHKGYVIPYADNPMDNENLAKMVYLHIINSAEKYLYITTPYLILDNELVSAITFAAKRGVDVRIIFPAVPDHSYAYVLALDHFPALIKAGVSISLYKPGFIHAKQFLSDGKIGVVGTVNLDYRSLYHHFECALLMYETEALSDIAADFNSTLALCEPVTEESLKKRGFFSKLAGFILKVAAPLM